MAIVWMTALKNGEPRKVQNVQEVQNVNALLQSVAEGGELKEDQNQPERAKASQEEPNLPKTTHVHQDGSLIMRGANVFATKNPEHRFKYIIL